jgi:hypothetical protein
MDMLTHLYLYGEVTVTWGDPVPAFAREEEKYGQDN